MTSDWPCSSGSGFMFSNLDPGPAFPVTEWMMTKGSWFVVLRENLRFSGRDDRAMRVSIAWKIHTYGSYLAPSCIRMHAWWRWCTVNASYKMHSSFAELKKQEEKEKTKQKKKKKQRKSANGRGIFPRPSLGSTICGKKGGEMWLYAATHTHSHHTAASWMHFGSQKSARNLGCIQSPVQLTTPDGGGGPVSRCIFWGNQPT